MATVGVNATTSNVEDLYKMFDDTAEPAYDLENDETYRKLLESSRGGRQKTPMRLGTSSGFQRQGLATRPGSTGRGFVRPVTGFRSGTGMRPDTGFRPGTSQDVNRPMTAVRGAGFVSQKQQVFDPFNQGATMTATEKPEESIKDKIHSLEARIMQYVEDSMVSSSEGRFRDGLDKAKEASSKERTLIRMQEQAGVEDAHNLELTYTVMYNLANQYALNELYAEALNTYQLVTRNRMFSNSHRLKVNMGNVHFRQGHFHKAVKMYRMALDQVPSSQKNLRVRIMHNIGMVFVRMGQYEDAVASLEYIMSERSDHQAGLHLLLCYYALEERDKMKHAMGLLLATPLDAVATTDDDDEKYRVTSDDPEEVRVADAIRNDPLHQYEQQQKARAEQCVMAAAKLISPVIEDTFSAGYEWCVQAVKASPFHRLAADLEISKAVMYLKQCQINEAIDTLKVFEKEPSIACSAATNLSFIYYLKGDYESAEKYAEIVRNTNKYNALGLVNLGACAMVNNNLAKAQDCFEAALDCDPANFEALFNLGLVHKRRGKHQDALECFQRFSGPLALLPEVLYQMASVLEQLGDAEAAADCYQQLLGVVPTDAGVLQRLGQLYDREGDKQQAYHHHQESFRLYPGNVSVLNWLGGYNIELQVAERAQQYFECGTRMQPAEARWPLMVAGCHRRSGNLQRALTLYQETNRKFPDNVECLKLLVRLCTELGATREAQQYQLELRKVEKSREVRERVSSSRPGTASRRTGSGLSSRSGGSPVPRTSAGRRPSRLAALRDSQDSEESITFAPASVDTSYADPLGPPATASRPRTSGIRPAEEDFGDEILEDSLLPM